MGTQKSGTTALYRGLKGIPGVGMSTIKEPHFFDDEEVDWHSPNYAELHRHFAPDQVDQVCGEATPIYAYWPKSIERIRHYNPSARIIFILRHPVYRAFSHWHHEVRLQRESMEFSAAVSSEGRRRVTESPGGVHRIHSYVERGFYVRQVDGIRSLFPEHQILLLTIDELWLNPAEVGRRLSNLLGIDIALNLPRAPRLPERPPMDESVRRYLFEVFAEELASLRGLGVAGSERWPSATYREPFRDD